MAIVSSDIPRALTTGVRALFFDALADAGRNWEPLCMRVDSTKSEEVYNWLGGLPQVREFLGSRQAEGVREYGFSLPNKTWENTLEVTRQALEDEQYGQIRLKAQMLGQTAGAHKEGLMASLLINGTTALAYDGVAFFGTHKQADGTTNAGINVGSTAFSADAIQATREAMMRFKDDRGNLLRVNPDTLVIPPELEGEALEITGSDTVVVKVGSGAVGSGATAATNYTNIQRGRWNVIVMPDLTDTTDWYMFDTSKPIKPFIYQERVAATLESLQGGGASTPETLFMQNRIFWGLYARYNLGYGFWQLGYRHTVSGS